jgi:hypothetical protein
MSLHELVKLGDALSFAVVIATIAQWLPAIAAGLSIVWTVIRIYESRTVQRLLGRADEWRAPE